MPYYFFILQFYENYNPQFPRGQVTTQPQSRDKAVRCRLQSADPQKKHRDFPMKEVTPDAEKPKPKPR